MNTPAPAPRFRHKKLLTRPTLKFIDGKPIRVVIQSPMHIGKELQGRRRRDTEDTDKPKKEPATVCDVLDLDTGELAQIVCATIVKSTLNEEFPNDAYVGKAFEMTKMPKDAGKNYNKYRIVELEVDDSENVEVSATATAAGEDKPKANGRAHR